MLIVQMKGTQILLRRPEWEEPLGSFGRIMENSVFIRFRVLR